MKESFADVLTNIDCDFNFYLRHVLEEDLRKQRYTVFVECDTQLNLSTLF